jgi:hypothetical protein
MNDANISRTIELIDDVLERLPLIMLIDNKQDPVYRYLNTIKDMALRAKVEKIIEIYNPLLTYTNNIL